MWSLIDSCSSQFEVLKLNISMDDTDTVGLVTSITGFRNLFNEEWNKISGGTLLEKDLKFGTPLHALKQQNEVGARQMIAGYIYNLRSEI